jgi:hypothetical protein
MRESRIVAAQFIVNERRVNDWRLFVVIVPASRKFIKTFRDLSANRCWGEKFVPISPYDKFHAAKIYRSLDCRVYFAKFAGIFLGRDDGRAKGKGNGR